MAIGQVSINGATTATPYQQANPGITNALQNLSAKIGVKFETLAAEEKRKQENSEDFAAQTELTRMEGSWSREQTDFINNAPENGAGITDARYTDLKGKRDTFIQGLPQRLREKYTALTEGTLQDFTTNTYAKEYELRYNYQTTELTRTAGDLASEIRAGNASMESALATFEESLAQTDLPEAVRTSLMEGATADLGLAQFGKIAEDAASAPSAVRKSDGSDVAAGNLTPGQRGMLNVIAVDESGGRYDIRYDGGAGSTFTDFSDHPRVFAPTKDGLKSSAAGRYQFTATTWDDLVNRYGRATLPDFTDQSQDKAAILLARERYHMKRDRGDRSFDELMADGSDAELFKMKKILAGTGNATTWQAFQKMSDQKFIGIFRGQQGMAGGGTGSPEVPDVWNDPRFAGLSYEAKMQAASQAQAAQSALAARIEAAKTDLSNTLKAQVALGQAGETEILNAIGNDQIKPVDVPALMGLIKEDREGRAAAQDYAGNIQAGSMMNNNADTQKAALRFMRDTGVVAGIENQTPEGQEQLSLLFAAGGVMPQEVAGLIENMTRSPDPRQMTYGLDTLAMMRAKNPDMFAAAMSKEAVEMEGVWSIAKKYSPSQDDNAALEMMRKFRDPAQSAVRKIHREEAQKQLAEISDSDVVDMFDNSWFSDPTAPLSPQASATLRTDFNKLYETYYPMFQDETATKEFVTGQMKHNWGPDTVSGRNNLQYLGPTSAVSGYAPIDGSYDWMREDLLTGLGWDETAVFELITDGQTEAEIGAKQQASYPIIKRDEFGQMRMEMDENGMPKRIRFTLSPDIIDNQRDNLELTRLRGLESSLGEDLTGRAGVSVIKTILGGNKDIEKQLEETRELIAEREERLRRRKYYKAYRDTPMDSILRADPDKFDRLSTRPE